MNQYDLTGGGTRGQNKGSFANGNDCFRAKDGPIREHYRECSVSLDPNQGVSRSRDQGIASKKYSPF
jgi:hypothetical protein